MELFASKEHARLYAAYRPVYPKSMFDTVIEFCTQSSTGNTFNTALDVGCGSGQSTHPLATYFRRVIGLDVSENQIQQAKEKYPDLEFRVGKAEDLTFLEDASVDLVTVAAALHWFDQERFFNEIQRLSDKCHTVQGLVSSKCVK